MTTAWAEAEFVGGPQCGARMSTPIDDEDGLPFDNLVIRPPELPEAFRGRLPAALDVTYARVGSWRDERSAVDEDVTRRVWLYRFVAQSPSAGTARPASPPSGKRSP